jgi:hypothetical protein
VSKKLYQRCSRCRNNSAEAINQFFYYASTGPIMGGVSTGFFGIRVTSTSGTHGTLAAQPGYWTSTQIIMVDPGGRPASSVSALVRRGRAFHASAWGSGTVSGRHPLTTSAAFAHGREVTTAR